jgi:hypothetical protein
MKITFIAKILVLIIVLSLCQFLFASYTGFKDTPSTVRALQDALANQSDVLYLGDSTLYRGDYSEPDQRTLPAMLDELLPELNVAGVYHDAYHLELLEYFCRYAAESPNKPKYIILPINMRSFSDERVKRPEYQFAKEKLFLSNRGSFFGTFFRPFTTFKAYDLQPITQEEYLDIEVFDGAELLGTYRELRSFSPEKALPLHLRACYRYQLHSDHPHIQALSRIAQLCNDANIKLIVYSTPTDYERGNEVIGEKFYYGIHSNLEEVELALIEQDIELLNMTFSLKRESFAHTTYPDAYINADAKLQVARRLAESILR